MAEEKKKDKKKERQPSALKRDLQAERRRLRNRSFRSSMNTAVRILRDAVSKKEEDTSIQTKLKEIYSLVDTGVKKGVFKSNKAARTKSRLTKACAKA